uniref:Orf217 n=1 Tax=Peronospora tabacina TaxID=230439 RepID=A0A0P0H5Y4_9STRA|nr:orf217 [Peronospora tabacina]ALJ78434.1 orf217 [Peronospora tabacina]ALJ78481.1 orf217 [Peronospora tabacina]
MKKLKKIKITNLINYQQFLKNNSLKKNQFKFKNILFENKILYNNENLESYVIEFNTYKNIYLPFTLIKIAEISTINLKYENILLFNYDLTYNILSQFHKIMLKIILKKNKNTIKGRFLDGNRNNKKFFISILGFVFSMKPINLNNFFKKKKKYYFNKHTKKGFYKRIFNLKKKNIIHLINCYKFKYLNFKISTNNNKNILKKNELSRTSYIQTIIENQKTKKYSFKKNRRRIKKF